MKAALIVALAAFAALEVSGEFLWDYSVWGGGPGKAVTWDYADNGVSWCNDYTLCCASRMSPAQSPINLISSDANQVNYGQLKFSQGYFDRIIGRIVNNGHTLMYGQDNGPDGEVSGGPFGNHTYKFLQFHLHWGAPKKRGFWSWLFGSKSEQGSEHLLDGKRYDAEIHLVHMRTDFTNVTMAIQDPNGLAVLGFFINFKSVHGGHLRDINHFAKELKNEAVNAEMIDKPFKLSDLVGAPKELREYFSYDGSLTTPGCYEAVKWVVFANPIKANKFMMNSLSKLADGKSHRITKNYRVAQELHGRNVTMNI